MSRAEPRSDAGERDWTCDEKGRCNSSSEFNRLVARVEQIIRNSAHSLINGDVNGVACLIVAQLAHVEGFAPASQAASEGGAK